MKRFIYVLCALICSCSSTKHIERTTDIQRLTDTLYIYKEKVDSTYLHDSIYVKEFLRGDTVFSVQYKEKVRWRVQKAVDTVYIAKYDTIVKTQYQSIEVVKSESVWGKVKIIFIFLLLVVILYIVMKVLKK